jgi:hypothetical protein
MSNFICPTCKKEHTIPEYKMKMDCRYYDNNNNLLICDCDAKAELVSMAKWDGSCPAFGKFSSMTVQEKQSVLKKRSHEHFEKEIKEKKTYLDKQDNLNIT